MRPILTACLACCLTVLAIAETGKTFQDKKSRAAKSPTPIPGEGRVEGVGGVFIYAKNPTELAAWYRDKLGIELEYNKKEGIFVYLFNQRNIDNPEVKTFTVFSIYPAKGDLDPTRNQYMINFRVDNLDKFRERLRDKQVHVDKSQEYDYGRFIWIRDLDGNPIEVWQPK